MKLQWQVSVDEAAVSAAFVPDTELDRLGAGPLAEVVFVPGCTETIHG